MKFFYKSLTLEHMCDIIRICEYIGSCHLKCLGRRRKFRNISKDYSQICFKPCGIRMDELEEVIVYKDEMEAIRLADFENLYQQDASESMKISRTTFSRMVSDARRKIADAILHQKVLIIKDRA